MDLAVILGASIMLVGVLVGFIFMMAAVEMKKEKPSTTQNNVYTRPDFVSVNESRQIMGITEPYEEPSSHTEKVSSVIEKLTETINTKEFTSEDLFEMKEKLERVLFLLRENSKEIPEDVADEIEELVQNVVDRMNP